MSVYLAFSSLLSSICSTPFLEKQNPSLASVRVTTSHYYYSSCENNHLLDDSLVTLSYTYIYLTLKGEFLTSVCCHICLFITHSDISSFIPLAL